MSDAADDLRCRLLQLQSCFTWDLKEEQLELDDLSRQLQHDIELQLGQPGAEAHACRFLAYVRYLQGQPEEALSLLNQSEEKTRESYGEEDERRLIVTYGDLAWLRYHRGDFTQSRTFCQRVHDILVKHPLGSSSDLHPEVYGEKGWTFLKFSKFYYPRAIECFKRALELQPDDCEWNAGYAIALFRTEPNDLKIHHEESPATKQLRRAVEINPDDGVLLSMLALKLVLYQKHREAEGLVERALEVGPDDPQVIRYVAKFLRKQDQLDRSIDLLQRVMRRSSQSAFIHHQLALCYKRKKKNLISKRPKPEREVQHWRRLSIQNLEEAVRLKTGLNLAKADLALQYAEESDGRSDPRLRRAQRMFDEVLETVEDETWSIRQSICRCYAEFCHYHSIQKDCAVSYYMKALEFRPDTSEARHCAKKLRLMAERRLWNDRGDAAAYGILGDVAKAEGDRRTAVRYYEKALQRDADNEHFLSALLELRLLLQEEEKEEDQEEPPQSGTGDRKSSGT
ncbi:interferon-induced protein with tetratricopeptide repeats 5-like [Brachyistius frenatus]|uniref:interferon-induced protein with tetratricopeptide repeats 5-like n=1 Tax=Brachyistius frenatus TaxID=100188 RepID=UPI0037E987E5